MGKQLTPREKRAIAQKTRRKFERQLKKSSHKQKCLHRRTRGIFGKRVFPEIEIRDWNEDDLILPDYLNRKRGER
jgi:hypothetical protein